MFKDSSARYYQKNKERLKQKAHERYQGLSEEEKNKQEYGWERWRNLPEHGKQRIAEYRKIC